MEKARLKKEAEEREKKALEAKRLAERARKEALAKKAHDERLQPPTKLNWSTRRLVRKKKPTSLRGKKPS